MTRLRLVPALALAAMSLALPVLAQAPAAKPTGAIATHPDWPKAAPADVKSVESIINAVYNVISGPKGRARNWNRMRTLFVPGARLAPIRENGAHADVTLLDIDGYIERASKRMEADGFFEHSIANRVEEYGNLIQVWSTYESRHAKEDPKPFARGINSFQLLKDGDRFWVVQIMWDAETPSTPIPAKYLKVR
jgi:hypothetical protein